MSIFERPEVTNLVDGGKCWEHTYDAFHLKAYIPPTKINGEIFNYCYRTPLLLVFEETRMSMDEAISFSKENGFDKIAANYDAAVLFVYPTADGGWENADISLYQSLIAEVKMDPVYRDGIVEFNNFFTQTFEGYFIRGAKYRADIYSYGASADYVAKYLLDTVEGEYLWGPGEITPAMCFMERLSFVPEIKRTDIPVISALNSEEINNAFSSKCDTCLIRTDKVDYVADFYSFVWKYYMWCGHIELEPDFDEMNMIEETGTFTVKTSDRNIGRYKETTEHPAGYFAYYNKGLFDKGPVPLVLGFHGGGDSSMYHTFGTRWYDIAHRYGFLYVSVENHHDLPAPEAIQILDVLKERYSIDEDRIYATGFSMGSAKTWDMYHEYPEIFAGFMPCSALFPAKNNPFGLSCDDPKCNTTISVPMFYSGGEASPLPELPFQDASSLERAQYLARTNKLKADFESLDFSKKNTWEDKIYGVSGDRVEKIPDESRGSVLTVNYYDSEDGICRTALASVSGQGHECRFHSCENAWKFISQFSRSSK